MYICYMTNNDETMLYTPFILHIYIFHTCHICCVFLYVYVCMCFHMLYPHRYVSTRRRRTWKQESKNPRDKRNQQNNNNNNNQSNKSRIGCSNVLFRTREAYSPPQPRTHTLYSMTEHTHLKIQFILLKTSTRHTLHAVVQWQPHMFSITAQKGNTQFTNSQSFTDRPTSFIK